MMGTVERATGRWREILPHLGVDPRFLVNRHGPCPICGGKDRFRWDDRDGTGSYYCNQCGAGAGLLLVRRLHGWDHATACRAVDRIIGRGPPPAPPRSTTPRTPRSTSCRDLLAEARDDDLVARYLIGRGLRTVPQVLRGHPRLAYADDGRFLGRFPAMLAPVRGPNGDLVSIHRTYIGDVPTRKKLLSPVGKGAAVRLFEPTDHLGVAEGIETAIAAHELFGLPTWATISSTIMESFVPPAGVRRLTIFADHDTNFAGQLAIAPAGWAGRNAASTFSRKTAKAAPTPGPGPGLSVSALMRTRRARERHCGRAFRSIAARCAGGGNHRASIFRNRADCKTRL